MAAMKPRTGDGPMEAVKEGRRRGTGLIDLGPLERIRKGRWILGSTALFVCERCLCPARFVRQSRSARLISCSSPSPAGESVARTAEDSCVSCTRDR